MTTGIYLLRFANTDKVYIGQSVSIEKRFVAHKRALSIQQAAKKLQEAYFTYGMPTLEIILECDISELNTYEKEAIEIYDSINNGFNSIEPGSFSTIQVGEQASNSYHSNDTYISVFLLLVQGVSSKEIEKITGASNSVIASIRKCENHLWLADIFPEEYKILLDRKASYTHIKNNTAEQRGIVYPTIISPDGVEYTVKSLRGFAREHGLASSNLEKLLNGKGYSLNGWTVKNRPKPTYPKLVSPDGTVYEVEYGKLSAFASEHGLRLPNLSQLVNFKQKQHKGWKILV